MGAGKHGLNCGSHGWAMAGSFKFEQSTGGSGHFAGWHVLLYNFQAPMYAFLLFHDNYLADFTLWTSPDVYCMAYKLLTKTKYRRLRVMC